MKPQPPEYINWTVSNATTAGPGFVNHAITRDSALAEKTYWVLLYEEHGRIVASVVRDSSSTPGRYSEDRYNLVGSEWKFLRKITGKWQTLPAPPSDAQKTDIHNVPFFTQHTPSQEEIDRMKRLMPLLNPPDNHSSVIIGHSPIR